VSIEQTLISHATSHIIAAKARGIIKNEAIKGCHPGLSVFPVSLEPPFTPLWHSSTPQDAEDQNLWEPDHILSEDEITRLQIWISPEQQFDWNNSELFLKQLQRISGRAAFEVVGNNRAIIFTFLTYRFDIPIITAAFYGVYDYCEITSINDDVPGLLNNEWQDIRFNDFFPPPPYSHLFTSPNELRSAPLRSLIKILSTLEAPAIGVYQVIFQPVAANHNWHRNVQMLLDFEYTIKLQSGYQLPQRYLQQAPSGDLHQMAGDLETKAHNDKPFFAVGLRLGMINGGEHSGSYLDSLSTVVGMFQHGGRPLSSINESDYQRVVNPTQFEILFKSAITHRSGFLLNSQELTSLIHLPPLHSQENRPIPIELLETLPVRESNLAEGTWIGVCEYAGDSVKVCLPDDVRKRHNHLIGRSGTGKSTTQEHMILSDIEKNQGVAVLDPHGDLVERLLCLIPEHQVDRIIYFDPGDPNWIPIWNPLERIPGQDIGRTAENIVQAIQSFVDQRGWGDRLEHLLRNMVFSLIHLPNGTFLDIANLFQNKSEDAKALRDEILQVIENETVRRFWRYDYEKYGKDDFGPPKNKLSKLLVSESVSLMLSQPDSLFNFRKIMDEGMVLLANLSSIGTMARRILGCFILSLLHLTALSRSTVPIADRRQFHIHCDEAHRFMTDALEDLIAETRKYGVSLSIAHQYMSQFGKTKTDAISSVGSTVIFNVDNRDAGYLIKDLQKKVKMEDLISLDIGEAVARIGTEIVRFKTRPPLQIPKNHFRERIIEESRRKYYRPAPQVRKQIRRSGDRWEKPFSPLSRFSSNSVQEFEYDEF